jgi:hypothetical protein
VRNERDERETRETRGESRDKIEEGR